MNNSLKKRVMSRIYTEYVKNVFIEHLDYFMLLFFAFASFMLISIQDVIANMPKDSLSSAFSFLVIAVRDTSWIIQTLAAGFLIRVIIYGVKLAHRNMDTDWITTRFGLRY